MSPCVRGTLPVPPVLGQGVARPERGDEAARGTSGSPLNLGWWGIPLPAARLRCRNPGSSGRVDVACEHGSEVVHVDGVCRPMATRCGLALRSALGP